MGLFESGGRTLVVVADGMGGHSGGFEASRTAVARVGDVFNESAAEPEALLRQAILEAHEAVVEEARQRPGLAGMGTTMVALLLQGGKGWIGHVGDSRAYRVGEEALRLTRDHTQVNRMVDAGLLTEEEAARHSMGHVLDRSLGSDQSPAVEVAGPLALVPGERFVLCSDGFSNLVPDSEIAEIFQARDLDQAIQRGIGVALLRGGSDNTTIAALQVGQRRTTGPSLQRAVATAAVAGLIGLLLGLALG